MKGLAVRELAWDLPQSVRGACTRVPPHARQTYIYSMVGGQEWTEGLTGLLAGH